MLLTSTPRHGLDEPLPSSGRDLASAVADVLNHWGGGRVPQEKRASRRFIFRKPVWITPIDDQTGRADPTRAYSGFGLDLSTTGFGFVGRKLLPTKRAIIAMDAAPDDWVSMLFESRWIRFTQGGWYQIGGRLIECVPGPVGAPAGAEELASELGEVPDLTSAWPTSCGNSPH
jgi:hypothetical protein